MESITKLKELYACNSKHSNYQILPDKLSTIIGSNQIIDVRSRYERERLNYIVEQLDVENKSVLDIGGNSGFFSFEMIERGAKSVHHYEGNKAHSEFVRVASNVLECSDKIEITNGYYTFEKEEIRHYDIVLLLNVLHHLGDDYGDSVLSIDAAKEQMASQLNNMAKVTNYLIFQLGFCWKGDRNVGLFKHGTKKELIDFVTRSISDVWDVLNIGIPIRSKEKIMYAELDKKNIERDDSLGEFLNRPLFILKTKQKQ